MKAVDGVSFRVRKGTTFGIVGESGSGKTTIAKAVMGLVGVSGGSIRLEGNELVGIPEDRLKALRPKYQIVFQDPYSSLNPRMRVGKIVQDPLNLMDLGSHEEREEREKEVFEQIGLHQAQRALFPHQFSGGQRQRISIGRALASYPELIICDEPVARSAVAIQAPACADLRENNLTCCSFRMTSASCALPCDDIGVMYLNRFARRWRTRCPCSSPRPSYTGFAAVGSSRRCRVLQGRPRGNCSAIPEPHRSQARAAGSNTCCPLLATFRRHEEPELREDRGQPFRGLPSGQGRAWPASAGRGGRSDGGPRRNRLRVNGGFPLKRIRHGKKRLDCARQRSDRRALHG